MGVAAQLFNKELDSVEQVVDDVSVNLLEI